MLANFKGKEILFRADSGTRIGGGHLSRCKVLASMFKDQGASVSLLTRNHPGNSIGSVSDVLETHILDFDSYHEDPTGPCHSHWLGSDLATEIQDSRNILKNKKWDLIVVDHYALDHRYHKFLREFTSKILVLDDLGDRLLEADLVLDQNIQPLSGKYEGKVPKNASVIFGPEFTLFQEDLRRKANRLRKREISEFKNLLVFFGQGDVTGQTLKCLKVLTAFPLNVFVLPSLGSPDFLEVKNLCQSVSHFHLFEGFQAMGKVFEQVDFALGAGGVSQWERMYCGIPSAIVTQASNQAPYNDLIQQKEWGYNLGQGENLTSEVWSSFLNKYLQDFSFWKNLRDNSLDVFPLDCTERCLLEISKLFEDKK